MFGFERFDRHAELAHRMADTLGLDLLEAVQRGELAPDDMRASVYNCLACRESSTCQDWLDANRDGSDAAPNYCRNTELFRALRG